MALGVEFGFGCRAFGGMILGAWFWADGFGRMVWLWANSFERMVLGIWFSGDGFGCMALAVWFGFGRIAWRWAYGFGRIVWMYDFGGTALQMRAGQVQKYIPILNRKIND